MFGGDNNGDSVIRIMMAIMVVMIKVMVAVMISGPWNHWSQKI